MKIAKRDTEKKNSPVQGQFETITANQALMILHGLTSEVVQTCEEMYIKLNGYGHLVIDAVKTGRSARFDAHQITAARDCCVLVNGVGYNTSYMYISRNNEMFVILRAIRPTGEEFASLNEIVGEHLSKMKHELRIVSGGFGIRRTDDYDPDVFGKHSSA